MLPIVTHLAKHFSAAPVVRYGIYASMIVNAAGADCLLSTSACTDFSFFTEPGDLGTLTGIGDQVRTGRSLSIHVLAFGQGSSVRSSVGHCQSLKAASCVHVNAEARTRQASAFLACTACSPCALPAATHLNANFAALAREVVPPPGFPPQPAMQTQFLSPRQMLKSSALTSEVALGATYNVYCFAQSPQGVSDADDTKKLTWVAPGCACCKRA